MGEAQDTGVSSQANDSQPAWIPAVKAIAEPLISDGVLPGLIVRVEPEAGAPEVLCLGSDWDGQPLEEGTLFPVASITKLATALAILRLADMGFLSLDDPLERFLPDAAAAVDDVTPRALLCHTSGLPEDLPRGAAPYTASLDWPTLAQAFLATPLTIRPWRLVNYSNTGYALLAVILERLARLPYPLALRELVLSPLEIDGSLGEEPPRRPVRIAGEWGKHQGTALEPYNSPFWRALGLPYGGLVTTVQGALRLVQAFAGFPAGFLPGPLLREATSDQTRGLPANFVGLMSWAPGPWGLGVELRGVKSPHTVTVQASPGSYGHLGASGAQAWKDPAAGLAWAILGPRTFYDWWQHLARLSTAILTAPRQEA